MFLSKRMALIVVCCAGALAGASAANAVGTAAKQAKLTQRITKLFSTSRGTTNVGASDGKVGTTSLHGALRAVSVSTGGSGFRATGTLFYPVGTLRYTLTGTATRHSDGSVSISASGSFTGGTGRYQKAHGAFTASGHKPANSYESWTLTGKVSYQ